MKMVDWLHTLYYHFVPVWRLQIYPLHHRHEFQDVDNITWLCSFQHTERQTHRQAVRKREQEKGNQTEQNEHNITWLCSFQHTDRQTHRQAVRKREQEKGNQTEQNEHRLRNKNLNMDTIQLTGFSQCSLASDRDWAFCQGHTTSTQTGIFHIQ